MVSVFYLLIMLLIKVLIHFEYVHSILSSPSRQKRYVVRKNKKTALSVQIFQDGDFKKKIEFVFRTPDAETISTAIE